MSRHLAEWLLAGLSLAFAATASAQTFVDPAFDSELVVQLPAFEPVGVAWAPDGAMFVWQKNGVVRVFRDGALLPTPFIDLSNQVNTFDDRGLLGLALDPDFDQNGYVYLGYVYEPNGNQNDTAPKTSRLTRVTANPSNPDVALPGSEVVLIGGIPADLVHTVGTLRFAPDGTLFVGNGDGGTAAFADPQALGAQDLSSYRGKILRINKDGSAPAPPQQTNPFYDGTNSVRSRVWAYGLRNPYRFDFHPTLGDLYAGDVGWNTWEEIDRIVRGGNYGWPCYEGAGAQPQYQAQFPSVCGALAPSSVIQPLYTYDRSQGSAAVGGAFYTGGVYPPAYDDNFFFTDYTGGWIRRLVLEPDGSIDQNLLFASDVGVIVMMDVGPDGLLYVVDFLSGQVRRIIYDGVVAVASATPQSGYSPLTVSFSSAGSADGAGGPLSYHWNFGDGAISTAANPQHTYVIGGVQTFTATLQVSSLSSGSSVATVPITVGSVPPVPVIHLPASGSAPVEPGTVVAYSGSASDPDEGTLSGAALQWDILLHHNTHVHASVVGTGTGGSFTAAYHGIGEYAYELILTATDSSGLQGTTSVLVPVLPDTTPPSTPENLVATVAGSSVIQLSWAAATDNGAVAEYHVERCQGASCSNFAEIATSGTASYQDSGLSPSTTYRFRVSSEDQSENVSGYSNVATATTSAGPPPLTGLMAAWGMNEGSGSAVADSSGNANSGSISGATWVAGRYGQGLSFDGINDVVLVPDANSLDLSTAMTLEAWVRPTSTLVSWKAVLQKQVDAYFINGNTSSGRPGIGGTFSGACCTIVEGPATLPLNQWTHVAGTYDGALLRLFINGAQVASTPRTGSLEVNAVPLRIGGNTYGDEFFPGLIDEVRIYNRALSAAEITLDMNTPVGGVATDTTPPLRSNGLPTGVLSAGTAQASLSLATNESATCRYGTVPGTSYASLPNAFATTGGSAHSTPISGLGNGQAYSFYVRCQDTAPTPNANPDDFAISFSVANPSDTTPPSATVTQPTEGALLSGIRTLAATASDNSGIVSGVQFLLDGTNLGAEDLASPYDLVWDTRTTANGTHVLAARARDGSSNLGTSAPVNVTVDNPPLTGLMAAWGMNEGSGSAVADSSGNANSGSISGATWVAGRYGQGLSFDGINDVVLVPDANSLDLSTAMTLEAWVRPTSTLVSWKAVLQKQVDAYFINGNTSSGRPGIGGTFSGACCTIVEGPATLPLNQWTHVAGTYDGALLRLFINGAQVASTPRTGSLEVNAVPLRIGGNTYGDEFFPGLIDEVRIYNRALSAAEITLDMNTPVGGVATDTTPPLRSNGLPTGVLSAGTAQASLSLATNEAATCRYGTVPGTSYASLPNAFATTGGSAHSTPISGLGNGQAYSFYVRCQDTAPTPNANPDDFAISFSVAVAADTTPPARSNGLPTGTLAAGTTQTTLSLATNEAASCRYGTVPGTAFAALPNAFATTGGSAHSTPVSGLGNGQSYTFYVRCQDTAPTPNANPDDLTISFSVAAAADTTPPVRSNGLPTGTLAAGTTQTTLSLATNESATCRYGTVPGTAYAALPNAFATTGGSAHSTPISGLGNGQTYTFYVRCQDAAPTPNANPNDFAISFSVGGVADVTPPVRSNGLPTGTLAVGTTQTTLSLATNESATCRYGTVPGTAYAALPNAFATTGGSAHSTPVSGLGNGQTYTFYVRCQDAAPTPNANPNDFAISFSIAAADTTPPARSNGLPTGTLAAGTTQTTLSLATNEAATCRYGTVPGTSYAFLPNAFATTGGNAHSTPISGLGNGQAYTFYVRCQDAAPTPNANPDDFAISFSVGGVADVTPPVRSNGLPTGTLAAGTTQTTLSLATNESATCRYGTVPGTAFAALPNAFATTGGSAHSTPISGLGNGQAYTFYVRCQDTAPTPNANPNDFAISFSVAADTTPPVRSNGLPTGTLAVGTTQTTLSLATNEAATCRYGTVPGTAFAALPNGFATTGGSAHSTPISGLGNGQSYTFYVRCQDAAPTPNANPNDFAISFSVASSTPPPTTGLVAAWGMNQGSGSAVVDSSGNANSGSISGATWVAGRYGQGLSFDGVNDVVLVPDANSLDLSTGMTLEAWVLPTSTLVGWKAILQKQVDAYFLNANTDGGRPGVGGTFSGLCCTFVQGLAALPLNQWTHVAGTYDGAVLRLFINGAQVASTPRTGSLEVNAVPLRIGGNTYGGEFFPGLIDEVRIYNRARSAAEITLDMNTPIGP